MARLILSHNRGQVVRVKLADGSLPGTVIVKGIGRQPDLVSPNVIITGISYDQKANHQFMRSLGREIFLYTFGDDLGDVVVSGLGFAIGVEEGNCPDDRDVGNLVAGVDNILAFFSRFKVTATIDGQIPQVSVRIGSRPALKGYLVACRAAIDDATNLMAKFSLAIKLIPEAPATGFLEGQPSGATDTDDANISGGVAASNPAVQSLLATITGGATSIFNLLTGSPLAAAQNQAAIDRPSSFLNIPGAPGSP